MATELKLDGKQIYLTPTGFKLGSRGKVITADELYRQLSKGNRRKARKFARKNGYNSHASA